MYICRPSYRSASLSILELYFQTAKVLTILYTEYALYVRNTTEVPTSKYSPDKVNCFCTQFFYPVIYERYEFVTVLSAKLVGRYSTRDYRPDLGRIESIAITEMTRYGKRLLYGAVLVSRY